MKKLTFQSGIHPPHHKKLTEKKQIKKAVIPDIVYVPLQQHIGAPCLPLVQKGDRVLMGQKVGDTEAFVSAPVHSTVSGVVKDIVMYPHPVGGEVQTIVIENDFLDEVLPEIVQYDWTVLTADELKAYIRNAGIVGMGGATFPTHVKLSPPPEKKIDTIIINGAECEPYLTSDHRLMLEQPEKVINGLRILMKVLKVSKGYIGVEDNKPDAIRILKKALEKADDISILSMRTKYPQGAEKQLIDAITGRRVPSGGLPMDVGVVVDNVGTAVAVFDAIVNGVPLIERVVTVTGDAISDPQNLLVRIGSTYRDIIEQCGGFSKEPEKIISGGPMMGIAQHTIDIPVIKGTSGILCLSADAAKIPIETSCIKCSKCVQCCPIQLMPGKISDFVEYKDFKAAIAMHAMDCIECGCCSFACPAKRPLTQYIRLAKKEAVKQKQIEAAKNKK